MFIGSTLGRIAVTRARAEAVIAQLDSRLKTSERELRTGAADRDRTAALTDECASLVGGVVFRGQLLGPRLATPPFVLADWYWDS